MGLRPGSKGFQSEQGRQRPRELMPATARPAACAAPAKQASNAERSEPGQPRTVPMKSKPNDSGPNKMKTIDRETEETKRPDDGPTRYNTRPDDQESAIDETTDGIQQTKLEGLNRELPCLAAANQSHHPQP